MSLKRLVGQVKIAPSLPTVANLDISTNSGSTYVTVSILNIPANPISLIYTFPDHPIVDIDSPTLRLKCRIIPGTTTTTSSTTTTTTTVATTTTTTTSSTTTTSTTIITTSTTSTTSSTNSGGGNVYTIVGLGSSDTRSIDGSVYDCGDTIILQGTFNALEFVNLNGCSGNYITITNPIGQTTTIGNPLWDGGSWSTALAFRNCHYVNLVSSSLKSDFVVSGSIQAGRTAYFDLAIVGLSDNFIVSNITIQNGGTGLYAKTEPVPGNTTTYDPVGGPYTYLNNFVFHDLDISGTYNEGTYVGHTGPYWDLTINQQFNGTQAQFNPTHQYAEPKRLNNVQIYNLLVRNGGADGIQTAAAENMVIHHNEVFGWANRQDYAHNGGILVGGKSRNVEVYCNWVHDGWGELCQCYGDGLNGSFLSVHNNLFENNFVNASGNDGCTFKLSNNLGVHFFDNTIVKTGGNNMRMYTTGPHLISRNNLIQPRMAGGTISNRAYIYDEPGVTWTEGTGSDSNGKFLDITTANVDPNNWYKPNVGSPATGKGYVRGVCDGSGTTTTTTSTSTTSTSTTSSTTTTTTTTGGPTTTTTSTTSTSTTSTSTSTTTTTTSSTTTTSTTSSGAQFFAVNNWKSGSPNQYAWTYLPYNYTPGMPAIIFLHGQGETGAGSGTGGILDLLVAGPPKYLNGGDRPTGVVIFCPQLNQNPGTWEPNWVEDAVNFIIANYNVDPNRISLTGLSLGGTGTAKYVGANPNKIASFVIATGDTQYLRLGAEDDVIGGIRVSDVPGRFLAGVADGTISVNNGYGWMTAANALSPKPIYPPLINTFWGIGHSSSLWDTQVYNRKNRTDATGTAAFDYIDWLLGFKINDLVFSSDRYVSIAESTNDWSDYRIALVLVNKLSAGSLKTSFLNRLAAVKSIVESSWKVVEISFGSTVVPGNVNTINITEGQTASNLVDVNGVASSINYVLVNTVWDGDVACGTNNAYLGMPTELWARGYRIYNTNLTQWRWTGLSDSKTYKFRFIYGNMTQTNTTHYGARVTIGATTKNLDQEMQNTNNYVDFTGLVSSGSLINATLEPIVAGQQGDILGMIIFESVGTTTTTTSTSSTSTTSTSSTSTTSTTSTSTTTTTSSSTTTTTTTENAANVSRWNFNLTNQSITGWNDISGNPSTSIITKSDTISSSGITFSSVATNKWGAFGGNSSNNANGGTGTNSDFPANVLLSFFFNYALPWGTTGHNCKWSGLTPSASYRFDMIGSRSSVTGAGIPSGENRMMQYHFGTTAAVGSPGEVNMAAFAARDSVTTVTQNFTANASGEIYMGVFGTQVTTGDQIGFINGVIITPL